MSNPSPFSQQEFFIAAGSPGAAVAARIAGLETILQATRAIASEIALGALLTRIVEVALESTGAGRGVLLLGHDTTWSPLAEGANNGERVVVVPLAAGGATPARFPVSIVHYVARMQSALIYADATEECPFVEDAYLRTRCPRALLCAPLVMQGQTQAVLYLEHREACGIFDAERVAVLDLILAHAVIAIRNARLYAAVQENETRLKQFLDAIPISVLVLDAHGRPFYANLAIAHHLDADVAALGGEELLTRVPSLITTGEGGVEPETLPIRRALRGEVVTNQELDVVADGQRRTLDVNARPVYDQQGQITFVVATMQDITKRRAAERVLTEYQRTLEQQVMARTREAQAAREAAEAASHAKSTFLANMSHELRTPLNAILGFAQLLQIDSALGLAQRRQIDIIARSGEHLLTLINDVLELSKIEANHVTLSVQQCNPHQLLDGISDLFALRALQKGLHFSVTRADDLPPTVYADERKLRQILINLVGNAIKFTAVGSVSLRLGLDAPIADAPELVALHFVVGDTGPGIAPEQHEQIFEPFVQAAGSAGDVQGSGLGLTISRQFVRLMGGDILVESQTGQGSTFSFSITVRRIAAAIASPDLATPTLTQLALSELPPEWIARLHLAAKMADMEASLAAIAPIDERLPTLAAALRSLVLHFRFDQLVELSELAPPSTA
ncbi:MAG: PAS domain-containing protein [Chloroflexales bacterium]|nr:PAS domain-containing protein [Chloroflexales bacterium]